MSVSWIDLGAVAPTDRVALVGDSLAVGLTGPLKNALTNPFEGVAKGGTDVRAWLSGSMASALNAVLAAKPRTVLISLGTNDTAPASQPNAATIRERVLELVARVRAAGAEPVWLLPGPLPWKTDALYAAVKESHAATVEQPPGISKPDKIHPSGAGYTTWAEAIATSLKSAPATPGLSRGGGLVGGALIVLVAVGILWATLNVRGRDADLD